MIHVRLAVICVATLLLASANASANIWDAIMDFRKPNIKIGQLALHPYYNLTGSYDDNIYKVTRDQANGQRHGCGIPGVPGASAATCSGGFRGSWITTNNLGLNAKLPLGNHKISVGYNMTTTNYKVQPKANDAVSQGITSAWNYKGGRIKTRVWNDYINTEDPPFNPNTPANGELVSRENRWQNTVGASIEYALGDKFYIEGHGAAERNKYRNPTLSAVLDRSNTSFGAKIGYRVFPKTRVFIVGDRSVTRYSAGRDANHKDWHLNAGIEGRLAPKVKGMFQTGFRHANYDTDNASLTTQNLRQTDTTWTSELNLTYQPQKRTSINLSASSSVKEAVTGGNFYISRGLSLRASHSIRKLTFSANGAYANDKYSETVLTEGNAPNGDRIGEEVQRRDDSYVGGLKIAYKIQDWLGVHTSYTHSRRHSILSRQFNYKQNTTEVGLSAAF